MELDPEDGAKCRLHRAENFQLTLTRRYMGHAFRGQFICHRILLAQNDPAIRVVHINPNGLVAVLGFLISLRFQTRDVARE